MSQYDVYGIGNALVDVEYRVTPDDLSRLGVDKGVMTLVEADRQSTLMDALSGYPVEHGAGGSAANSVIALAQLGGRGYYTCKVAHDELGRLYADDLEANGVGSNARDLREDGHTGRCLVFVTPDADRTMATYLGITGDLGRDELDPAALRASQYLYMEGYLAASESAREAAVRARAIADAAGVRTALSLSDPNIVAHFQDELVEMVGPGLDLIFANEDEARGLCASDRLDDTLDAMKNLGREFVITRGPKPSLVWDGRELSEIAARPVDPIDTLGAGDVFAGAFLYGLTRDWPHAAAGELATAAAARLITVHGPRLDAATARGVRDAHVGTPSADAGHSHTIA